MSHLLRPQALLHPLVLDAGDLVQQAAAVELQALVQLAVRQPLPGDLGRGWGEPRGDNKGLPKATKARMGKWRRDTHAMTWWKSERSFCVACRYSTVLACGLSSPSQAVLPACQDAQLGQELCSRLGTLFTGPQAWAGIS